MSENIQKSLDEIYKKSEKETLGQIERDIVRQLSVTKHDANKWKEIYIKIRVVHDKKLYAKKYASFNKWMNEFAVKKGKNISTIYNKYDAGKTIDEYLQRHPNSDLNPFDKKLSPDTLRQGKTVANKLGKTPEEKMAELDKIIPKIVAGKITRKDLIKRNKQLIAKGRGKKVTRTSMKAQNAGHMVDALVADGGRWLESSGSHRIQDFYAVVPEVDAGEKILDHMANRYSLFWSKPMTYKVVNEVAARTGTTAKARRLDAVVLENLTDTTIVADHLNLHGIEIKNNVYDLSNDHKMAEYASFVDYFWLFVPKNEKMIDAANRYMDDDWGLITIDDDDNIEVENYAKNKKGKFDEKTLIQVIRRLQEPDDLSPDKVKKRIEKFNKKAENKREK